MVAESPVASMHWLCLQAIIGCLAMEPCKVMYFGIFVGFSMFLLILYLFMASQRPGRCLKSFLVAAHIYCTHWETSWGLHIYCTHWETLTSHGNPIRDKNCGLGTCRMCCRGKRTLQCICMLRQETSHPSQHKPCHA